MRETAISGEETIVTTEAFAEADEREGVGGWREDLEMSKVSCSRP